MPGFKHTPIAMNGPAINIPMGRGVIPAANEEQQAEVNQSQVPNISENVGLLDDEFAIQTQQAQPKTAPKPQQAAQQPEADYEPTEDDAEGFEQMFEEVTGQKPTDFRETIEALKAFQQRAAEAQAAQEFIVAHKHDYVPTPENAAAIEKYMQANRLTYTRDNLERAFADLNQKQALVRPKRPSGGTGLSDRSSARIVQQPDNREALERKIHSMSLDEARAFVTEQFYRMNHGQPVSLDSTPGFDDF